MMSRTLVEAGAVEGTFYAEAAAWIAEVAERTAVVVDVGGGSGAAACALARALPKAYVVVAHRARPALERARSRSVAARVAERLETCECRPGDGVLEDEPADLVWARDLVPDAGGGPWSLRQAAQLVRPGGLLAWAEGGRATRVLDDDLGLERPGLLRRLEAAARGEGAALAVEEIARAGLRTLTRRTFLLDVPAPLGDDARAHVVATLRRLRAVAGHRLDAEDARALDCLLDPFDPRSAFHREALFYRTSPRVHLAYRD